MRKLLFTIVSMLLPMLASADAVEIGGIYYNIVNNAAEVTGNPNKYSGSVVIPEKVEYEGTEYSVTGIGKNAFDGCRGLTSITIPNSVTSIGSNAFKNCSGLLDMFCYAENVPTTGSDAFSSSNIANATLHVPTESVGAYQAADQWKNFKEIVALNGETPPRDVDPDGNGIIDNVVISGIYYDLVIDSKEAIVKQSNNYNYRGNITIPETVKYGGITYRVTSIGINAFWGCSDVASVTIPNSVTSIGGSAFLGCWYMTSITIPNSVTSIGGYAFSWCAGLTSIKVESGNTKYDSRDNCNAIIETKSNTLIFGCQNTTIPNSVTSIGDHAFYDCWYLTSITIPNNVKNIRKGAFYECSGLTSITIPNSVTRIEEWAFGGCSSLTSIKVESGNTKYDSRDNCNAIIETASNTLLAGCQNTTIPNSVTTIGKGAFYGSGLTSIIIPNSVTSIGQQAFSNCSDLANVYCYAEEVPNTQSNAFAYTNTENATLHVPAGSVSAYQAAVPWKNFKNIVEMESEAPTGYIEFADANVKAICIENWDTNGDGKLSYDEAAAVKDLGQVFKGNPKIVSFDEFQYFTGVETINRYEFEYCENLSSIKFPNSIKHILLQAFIRTSLTSISIPKSVIGIAPVAFMACKKLASITVEEGNTVYDSRDNCNAIIDTRSNALIVGCKNTVIPASVTAIDYGAFDGCTDLMNIEIPSRVRYIGPAAFAGCGLTSITIPKSVSDIGEVAFQGCLNLSSITVEEGNTVYDSRNNCNAIINTKTNVLISGCKSTVIPNTVMAIGKRAFEGHESLTEITIPNSVTSIEENAFYSTCIESLHIPSSVTTIGSQAFGHCYKLKTITFEKWPENVGSKIVFYGFNSLEKVIVLDRQPTAIGNDTFLNHYDGTWTAATLYVPAGTKAIYEATDGWKNFKNIVEMEAETSDKLLLISKAIGNVEYKLYKQCTRKDDIHENPDGWRCYKSQLILEVTKGGETASYVVDDDIYLDDMPNEGQMACMMFDMSTRRMYVFCISKDESKNYTMEGYFYASSMDIISFQKETVFTYSNWGWRPYFMGIENGQISISHFSFAGYYSMVSARSSSGEWTTNSVEYIYPDEYTEIWKQQDLALVVNGSTSSNIVFADAEVKRFCVENWDTNGDGELSYDEAAAVTDLGEVFKEPFPNRITSFNELQYFTGLKSIGYMAFNYSGLESVTIPNSVTSIGDYAFYGCHLPSITIPNSVTTIGEYAFCNCGSLTSITIPNSVTSIGKNAFSRCESLTSFTIPNSMTRIEEDTFYGCHGLTTINISNSVTSIGGGAFHYCSGLTSIMIPHSVTSIEYGAFWGCRGLTSITIPNSVTSIGGGLFGECASLTSITVEGGNAYYDSRNNCNAIIETASNTLIAGCTTTIMQNSVTSIGESAFADCNGLTSIIIPNSVMSIGKYAFDNCNGLTSVTIPNSVTSIGESAFSGCGSLTSITFGNSVTSIGKYAFNKCSSLTSITLPNSLTSIGYGAFWHCSGLTSVTIGSNVTSIDYYAFYDCSSLLDVYCYAENVPTGSFFFDDAIIKNTTLHVPAGSIETYRATSPWKDFKEIVAIGLEPVDKGKDVDFAEGGDITEETDLTGIIVNNIYYNIGTDAGGYSAEDGCIVISKETSDEQMAVLEGLGITDEILKQNFTGIIFKVPAGSGKVTVTAETTGNMTLKVKVCNSEAIEMELSGKLKMTVPYNVSEETMVYIFAGTTGQNAARGQRRAVEEPSLRIYGISVESNETGFVDIKALPESVDIYSLDGRMVRKSANSLIGLPKGVYIINGHKVVK